MKRRIVIGVFLLTTLICASACSLKGEVGANESKKTAPAPPVMLEGRIETDVAEMLPRYRYTLKEVMEVNGRQGIASWKGNFYVSDNKILTRYDKYWFPVQIETDPLDSIDQGVNHIGDIDVYNDEVYASVEYFRSGDAKHIQIAVYDADNFKFQISYPIDPKSKMTEISGIAVDPDNDYIWLCSWADDDSGKYLYAYDLNDGTYIKKVQLLSPPRWIQGIAYHDGYIFITSDDGDAELGEPDHIYRCKVDPDAASFPVVLERTMDDVVLPGEIEGISFDTKKNQMLVNYNRGKRIVKGMDTEYYEGYDKEIHEIYIYDMARLNP